MSVSASNHGGLKEKPKTPTSIVVEVSKIAAANAKKNQPYAKAQPK